MGNFGDERPGYAAKSTSWGMRRHFWRFEADDGVHVVELVHGFWSGSRDLFLDGMRIVHVPHLILDFGSEYDFTVCGRQCSAQIKYFGGLDYTYRFSQDGEWLDEWDGSPEMLLLRPARGPDEDY